MTYERLADIELDHVEAVAASDELRGGGGGDGAELERGIGDYEFAAAWHYVPELVAEVRRLREALVAAGG